MSNLTHHIAIEHAVKIVEAAAHSGSLKLSGVPMGSKDDAKVNGELDGAYVAALIRSIAAGIKIES